MRIGLFEVVLIIAVILSVAYIWRWLRDGRSDAGEAYENEGEEGSEAPGGGLRSAGLILVLSGLGLLVIGYIVITGLASLFIWATAILLLGIAFLLLSRR